MGLTIHYELIEPSRDQGRTRRLVEELREEATRLPFKLVGTVLEADHAEIKNSGRHDPRSWLFTQSTRFVRRNGMSYPVTPLHLIAFSTCPGDGCEELNLGLAVYPATIKIDGKSVRTGLRGWSWSSFCKTVYASRPEVGGPANFLKCHLAVVSLLDFADTLGVLGEVDDEGGYWQRRDRDALLQQVGGYESAVTA
jgi:hypothetical protein